MIILSSALFVFVPREFAEGNFTFPLLRQSSYGTHLPLGSRKKVLFLVVRPLGGGGGMGPATKAKGTFFSYV